MEIDIAVLLVDDQELVRSGLRRILRRKDGFVVVAECADGDEVPGALAEHTVDVVVMDLRMKRVDGIDDTRRLVGVRLNTTLEIDDREPSISQTHRLLPVGTRLIGPAVMKEIGHADQRLFGDERIGFKSC